MSGCTAKVADHTDTVACGEFVLRAGLCSRHLHEETHALQEEIQGHEVAIARCRNRLVLLNTESG